MNSFLQTSDPEIAKIIKQAAEMRQQQPLPKINSCPRCGEIGHISSDCPNSVPSADEMQNSIEERIKKAVALAPETWENDDMGLFLPSHQNIIQEKRSWKDGPFCFNCGEFGHSEDTCTQPTYKKIVHVFGRTLEDKGHKAIFERQHLVDDVKSLCERSESQNNQNQQQESNLDKKDSVWS
ncbi:Zinc knuckle family protein [Tritrichomonas foetus]|uniref:Zinc knuckle family protein n=1 Tax=Tritrichomonas foetus TaxID=1144522 RepID=A0A1J4J9W0_9EUKA|nr:Zinc knuckle family protein [Tritrichomonas foetus]|eukprot:OHS95978.1 Zinc knuckle family protein [Tritrichomonas foetus]